MPPPPVLPTEILGRAPPEDGMLLISGEREGRPPDGEYDGEAVRRGGVEKEPELLRGGL